MRGALSYVRVRVVLAAVAAALVVGLVGAAVFVGSLRNALESGLVSSASQSVSSVQAQLSQGETPAQAVVSGKADVVVQIVGADGTIVATDHPRVTSPLLTQPDTRREVRVPRLEDKYVVVARRVKGGTALIVVGRSSEQVGEATAAATVLLAVAAPVGLAVLGLVIWLSVGRALRPVEAMRRQASVITSEHLHRRLEVPPGDDEIPRLATTLNQMLDRIDASARLQRQFVSDASHELRSPLSALRQLAEVAHRWPERVPTVELARDVLLEEHRMEDLVTALLTLARLDDGAEGARGEVDLDDVVLEVVRPGTDADSGVEVDVSGVGAGPVRGNPVLLAQVVRNLVGNARRHARSRVVVGVTEADGRVRLVVHDDGAGVPPDQREAVFGRFVRLDEARTRDAGGSGLGLAIVRKVVDAADGTVAVDEGPLGGARFTVDLPARPEPVP